MNRDIRRAQERKERKAEKDKQKRKEARRERRRNLRRASRVSPRRKADAGADGAPAGRPARGRMPGRFAGWLLAATTAFILLQAVAPPASTSTLDSAVSAAFYLLFGYFGTLWMLRRGVPRAPLAAALTGVALALGVELAKIGLDLFGAGAPYLATLDPLRLGLLLPLLVAGVLLGRLVFVHAPG